MPLFDRDPLYNDDGAMEMTNFDKNAFIMQGSITHNMSEEQHSISSMYDFSTLTYLQVSKVNTGDRWVKWDMGRKKHFKNIICSYGGSAASGAFTATMAGSNDDSNWTELDTHAHTDTSVSNYNLTSTGGAYRYIRMTFSTGAGVAMGARIYGMIGVVK